MKRILIVITCLIANVTYGQLSGQAKKDSIDNDTQTWWQQEYQKDLQAEMLKYFNAKPSVKDSTLYVEAVDAYDNSRKNENREAFIHHYILQAGWAKRDEDDAAKRVKDLNRKYGAAIAKKLLAEKVWIGMTDKMVIDEFGWADVKKAVTASGVTETWYYLGERSTHCIGGGCPYLDYYLVFKNHKLIAVGDL